MTLQIPIDTERDDKRSDMLMLEVLCGHVFFRVQDFLDAYKKQVSTNVDKYEEAKDGVLKIVGGGDNELNDSVSLFLFLVWKFVDKGW